MLNKLKKALKAGFKKLASWAYRRVLKRRGSRLLSETGSDYLFTVVVPIYNVEPYLEETLDSIVGQTVGFRDNIQLVLVNDGSPDDSGAICRRYLERYPENVVYVEQENAGVGAACNAGLALARGAFVNFMGADDKWSEGAFEEAARFLFAHKNVPFVSFRMVFFEAATGGHALNYKFSKTDVIDIFDTYDFPQLSIGGTIIRRGAIPASGFDSQLRVSEDFMLLTQIVLSFGRYGVSSRGAYCYRKRQTANSALDKGLRDLSWYFDAPEKCYKSIFRLSRDLYGEIIPYVQYCIMYDLQWRLVRNQNPGFLSKQDEERYHRLLLGFLDDIEDEVIARQRNLNEIQKLYVLSEKHGLPFTAAQARLVASGGDLHYRLQHDGRQTVRIGTMGSQSRILLQFVNVSPSGMIKIEGDIDNLFPRNRVKLFISVNGKETDVNLFSRPYAKGGRSFFSSGYLERHCFAFEHQIKNGIAKIHMEIEVDGRRYGRPLCFCRFAKLSTAGSYRIEGSYLLYRGDDDQGFVVEERSVDRSEHERLEARFIASLPRGGLTGEQIELRKRAIARKYGKGSKNKVWLISDSVLRADDNGRALFTYLSSNPIEGVDVHFVLSGMSPDFVEMEAIGSVIDRDSPEYDYLFLIADKIISSAAEDNVCRRFGDAEQYMKDLYEFDFVFLQHGVTVNDLSAWLNRFNKNIACIVTASPRETRAFLEGSYGYSECNLALTGFPRHDYLDFSHRREKLILFMPTWRTNLVLPYNQEKGTREKHPDFASSEYCKFINKLINDERLLLAMQSNGYTMDFVLHPALRQQRSDFRENEFVRVVEDVSYAHAFEKGSLLVTDYSSVSFDFALFKRPIIYVQFDRDTFYDGQAYSAGYYDYRSDGFGPVVFDLDSAVDMMIDQVEHGCIMDNVYKQRVDDFFVFPEKSRCSLLVNHLLGEKTAVS